jgi:KDO2-lipid IV(A) lauroyltransferase
VTQHRLPRPSRFTDGFHRLAFRLYPIAARVAPVWPRWLELIVSRWVVYVIMAVYPRPKWMIRRNLAHILGRRPGSWRVRRTCMKMLGYFGIYHSDLFRFAQLPMAEARAHLDVVQGMEHLEAAVASRKGALMLTAHFGNYELGGVLLGQLDMPVSVVYVKDKFEQAEEYRSVMRGRGNVEEIAIEPNGSWSSLPVLRALRAGRLVAMQGDRDLDGRGIPTRFFGLPILFPRGPFVVALLTGAPIIPTFVGYSKRRRFECRIYPPIELRATADRERDLAAAAAHWAGVLEQEVRRSPEQWYTFYDYFADHLAERAAAPLVPAPRQASA